MTAPHTPPRQLYLDWVENQIERYKAALSRDELLGLADEAVEQLFCRGNGQYPLTEVVLRETVDEIIFHRLGLPSFRAWVRRRERAGNEDPMAELDAPTPAEPPAGT